MRAGRAMLTTLTPAPDRSGAVGCASLSRSGRAELLGLEGLDVVEPVDDAAADLEVLRTRALVAPALERAGAQPPAARELDLIDVLDGHGPPRRLVSMGRIMATAESHVVGIAGGSGEKSSVLKSMA